MQRDRVPYFTITFIFTCTYVTLNWLPLYNHINTPTWWYETSGGQSGWKRRGEAGRGRGRREAANTRPAPVDQCKGAHVAVPTATFFLPSHPHQNPHDTHTRLTVSLSSNILMHSKQAHRFSYIQKNWPFYSRRRDVTVKPPWWVPLSRGREGGNMDSSWRQNRRLRWSARRHIRIKVAYSCTIWPDLS